MAGPDVSTLNSWMDKTLASLRQQLSDTWLSVSNQWMDSDAKAAYFSHLDQNQRWLNRLDGELRQQVLEGSLGMERWKAIAMEQSRDMASLYADGDASNALSRFWEEVVQKSAGQVTTSVTNAAKNLEADLPWWGLGVVVSLVALAIISLGVRVRA